MKLTDRQLVRRVAGRSEQITERYQEWVCVECDFFAERDPDDDRVAAPSASAQR